MVYQNLLREFWCTTIATYPNLRIDDSEVRPLKEYTIKFSVMNSKKPLNLDFKTFIESTGLDYAKDAYVSHPSPEILDRNHSSTEQLNSIKQLVAYCLLTGTKDSSKVTPIELTAFMVAVNNNEKLVNPLHFSIKKKKRKSQTVTLTLPQSQGPKASGSLLQKRKKPKSKNPPTETKVTPPSKPTEGYDQSHSVTPPSKPTEGYDQSHSVSSGIVPDPQDPEKNIQLADIQAYLLSKDKLAQESDEEEVFAARDDIEEDTQADEEEHQSPSPNKDKPEPSHTPKTQVSDSDTSSPDLKKYDNILPLTERQLVKYLRKASIEGYYEEIVDHMEQTNKVIDAAMNILTKTTLQGDILNALNKVTETSKPFRMLLRKILYLTRK
nr:hypothetical protein [Tanacetum cinerariifolium]